MDALTIDIHRLRFALGRVLDAIETKFGDALTLDVDYYWNVPLDVAYDPLTDPELDMGQASDDISSVHEFAAQAHEEPVFIWHECEHLAGVLRAIAKTDLQ